MLETIVPPALPVGRIHAEIENLSKNPKPPTSSAEMYRCPSNTADCPYMPVLYFAVPSTICPAIVADLSFKMAVPFKSPLSEKCTARPSVGDQSNGGEVEIVCSQSDCRSSRPLNVASPESAA